MQKGFALDGKQLFKQQLIREINDHHCPGMPKAEKLNALMDSYVDLAYPLPSGEKVRFLNDGRTYLGNQLESEFGGASASGSWPI